MQVKLTVNNYVEDRSDTCVKLEGYFSAPPLPDCPPGGYTHDGKYSPGGVFVSIHLKSDHAILRSLMPGTEVILDVSPLNPDFTPRQCDPERLAELKATNSTLLGQPPSA